MVRRTTVKLFYLTLLALTVFITSCSKKPSVKNATDARANVPEMVLQTGHNGYINDFVFDPTGEVLITGGWEGTIRIWDVKENLLKRVLRGSAAINVLAINPGSNLLAAGYSGGSIDLWDIEAGKVVKRLGGYKKFVELIAFLEDGVHLAGLGFEGGNAILRVWNIETGEQTIDVDTKADGSGNSVFSKDGSLVVALEYKWIPNGDAYYEILILDVMTGEVLKRFKQNKSFGNSRMALSPDNKTLAAVFRKRIDTNSENDVVGLSLIDVETGAEIAEIPWETKYLRCLEFSPDGKTLVANSGDSEFLAFEVPSGKSIQTIDGMYNQEKNLFSPDGTILATVGQSSIFLYNAETIELLDRFDFERPLGLFRQEDDTGDSLFAREQRRNGEKVEFFNYEWNLKSGTVEIIGKNSLHTYEKEDEPYRLIPEKGVKAAINKGGTLALFDIESGKRIKTLLEGRYVASTAFSRGGSLIASHHCIDKGDVCVDEKLSVWDTQTGELLQDIQIKSKPTQAVSAGMGISFFPDSSRLITMDFYENKSDVWNLKDGTLIFTLDNVPNNYLHFISPDGKFLFLHGRKNIDFNGFGGLPSDNYEIWNMETGKQVLYVNSEEKFDLKNETVHPYLSISPDSQTLGVGWRFCEKDRFPTNSFVSQCELRMIEFVDLNKGKVVKMLDTDKDEFEYFVYHPNGKQVITSGRDGVNSRDIDTWEVKGRFENQHYDLRYLYTGFDGRVLIAGTSEDGMVLWSMDTKKVIANLHMFPAGEWLVTDPAGRFDCSGCDKKDPERGMKYIRWRSDGAMYQADEFFTDYFKHGLLAEIVKNAS